MGLRRSVLRAIENATIAPGVITGLWDGTEVTADVNNSAVTTDAAVINNSLDATELTISSDPSNPTVWWSMGRTPGLEHRRAETQLTVRNDNVARSIIQVGQATGSIYVYINESGAGWAYDEVEITGGGALAANTLNTRSTPNARSYSLSGSGDTQELQVAINGGDSTDAAIGCTAIVGDF